jgi:hypothetical protein
MKRTVIFPAVGAAVGVGIAVVAIWAGGPALDITAWSHITLAPGGERVREIGTDAAIRVG